jgi:hypothetical protein
MSGVWSAPQLRELIRVVPIAQSQVHEGVTVIMRALELYADGFVVTFRVLSDDPWPFQDNPEEHGHLEVDLRVTTSSGSEYGDRMFQGGFTAGADGWHARFEYQHAPALDSDASWVRIEVPALYWLKRLPDPPYQATAQEITGPWIFTVALPA